MKKVIGLNRRNKIAGEVLLILLCFILVSTVNARSRSREGYLGVSIEKLTREERKEMGLSHGVVVTDIVEDSPAEEAGILEDDIIQYYDKQKIRRPEDLVRVVRQTKPKTEAKITLIRDKKKQEITVTIGRYRQRYSFSYGHPNIFFNTHGAYLGVELQELNQDLAEYFRVNKGEGALVLEVDEDSPAEDAGLKGGDVIVAMDEVDISDPEDVRDILSDLEEGDEVEVVVIRQGRKQRMKIELEERDHRSEIRIFKGPHQDNCLYQGDFNLYLPQLDQLNFDEDVQWQEDHWRDQFDDMKIKLETMKENAKRDFDRIQEKRHEQTEAVESSTWI